MKNSNQIYGIFLLVSCLLALPLAGFTQDNGNKKAEPKIKIKTIENVNGVETVEERDATPEEIEKMKKHHEEMKEHMEQKGMHDAEFKKHMDTMGEHMKNVEIIINEEMGDSGESKSVRKFIMKDKDGKTTELEIPAEPGKPGEPMMKHRIMIKDGENVFELKGDEASDMIWIEENETAEDGKVIKQKTIIKIIDAKPEEILSALPNSEPITDNNKLEYKELNVYPNPAGDNITLKFELPNKGDTRIKLVDFAGRNLFEETLRNFSGVYEKKIDLGRKAPGTYLLNVTQNGKQATLKVVKE